MLTYSRYQSQPKKANHRNTNFKNQDSLFILDIFTLAIFAATSVAWGFNYGSRF